jgi:uncharacterized protein YndB with AHSA1/START domain
MIGASRTLSVSIARPPAEVYDFVANAANLPAWAGAFCRSVRRDGAEWIVETPEGSVRLRFVTWNQWGVLDHAVTLASGETIVNPMRVIPNGSGSEVLFTLFQRPGMSDVRFYEDAGMVQRDLETLKRVVEGLR